MIKKVLALLLCFAMIFTVAATAFASDGVQQQAANTADSTTKDIPIIQWPTASSVYEEGVSLNVKMGQNSLSLVFAICGISRLGMAERLCIGAKDFKFGGAENSADAKKYFINKADAVGSGNTDDILFAQPKNVPNIAIIQSDSKKLKVGRNYFTAYITNGQNELCSEKLDLTIDLANDIFNVCYKSFKVYADANYIKIWGVEYDKNEKPNFYIVIAFPLATKADVYQGSILPPYENIKNVPKGLKVTGYMLKTEDGVKSIMPGDVALRDTQYFVDLEIDFSNPQTIVSGIFNYILFRISKPIYYGVL